MRLYDCCSTFLSPGAPMRASLRAVPLVVSLVMLPALAPAQQREPATRLGFSIARLARIDTVLQSAVDRGEIAGAVALVLRDGQPVYERAIGWSDREAARRMRTDDIFRIASQTKALTSVGIMSLVEEGRIALSDPVSRYIPAFDRTTVATRSDTGRMIAPARRRITIRDLLTHTAGISYGTDSLVAPLYAAKALGSAAGWGWYTADKDEPVCTTMERLATLPFAAQPGERFVYGYNTDVLGCVIERVSGMPLDAFIRARITDPLGMRDTHFFLPLDKRGRLATVYASTGETGMLFSPNGGDGFGLGFRTHDRAGAEGRIESVGTFGWGGAYGSQYEVDPHERLVLVFMIQQLPNRSSIPEKFPTLVYQALVEPR